MTTMALVSYESAHIQQQFTQYNNKLTDFCNNERAQNG